MKYAPSNQKEQTTPFIIISIFSILIFNSHVNGREDNDCN